MSKITDIQAFTHFRGLPYRNEYGRKIRNAGRYDYVFGYHIERKDLHYIFDGESEIRVRYKSVNICVLDGNTQNEAKDEDYPIFVEDMVLLRRYWHQGRNNNLGNRTVVVGKIIIVDYAPLIYIEFDNESQDVACGDIEQLFDYDPVSLGLVPPDNSIYLINDFLCSMVNRRGEK